MKVLLINQYFHPDMAATSQLLGDLARSLGTQGWEVTALAGRGTYTRGAEGDNRSWPSVTVRRAWSTNFGRASNIGRVLDYLTFLFSAALVVIRLPSPDIVVCLSTPPFVALLGVIARLKGSRLVYKVEDIYPEIAVALGTFTERSIATRFFSFVSRLLLEQADRVITLDDAMARRLREAGARDVETIPNWGDGDAIRPYPAAGQVFRDAYGLGDRFIVLYSGNMGRAHRFDAVVSAARECAGPRPDILFLFVGAGARFEEVRRATADLENVRFMGYQPREMLCALYAAADIHLVTLDDAAAGLLFPSKYAGALAAGKPVLLVGGLDAPFAGEIRQAGLGWAVPHSAPRVTGAIVDAASATSHQLELYGRNARRVFDAVYSKTRAMQRWDDVLNAAIGRERAATDAREAPVLKKARAASAR